MSKRVLITGAQGFLGRYLTAALLKADPETEVTGVGRSDLLNDSFTHTLLIKNGQIIPAPVPADIAGMLTNRYQYFPVDTNDKNQLSHLFKVCRPSAVIHLASGLKGDSCSKLLHTNIVGTLNLLSACKEHAHGAPFIGVSSGGVYGFPAKQRDLPFGELHPCSPEEPYQLTKAAEETIVKEFSGHFGIPWMALRVFNIIGPGQDERHVCGRFVSELMSIKNGYKDAYLKTAGLTSVRDFVDVRDVANNIVHLLIKEQYNQVFNISSGKPVEIGTVLNCCLDKIYGADKGNVHIDFAQQTVLSEQRIDQHFGDNKRLLNAGGIIDYSLDQSIRDIANYYDLIYTEHQSSAS